MSLKISKLLIVATLIVACGLPAASQVLAPRTVRVPPPALIYPFGGLAAPVPIIFRWTGTLPGSAYDITIQRAALGRLSAAPATAFTYQLQISDRPDVVTHVVFETTVNGTMFLFNNRNLLNSGFTDAQPPGIPLSGGRYFWRVRALSSGSASPFSQIGSFTLQQNPAIGTPLHDLGVGGILVAAARPRAGDETLLYATVVNEGTVSEHGATMTISVNGEPIASGAVPPLTPNEEVQLVAPWVPRRAGVAQVLATLRFVDMVAKNNTSILTLTVAREGQRHTTMVGTVRKVHNAIVLTDANGRTIATLSPNTRIDLGSFVGRRVRLAGILSKSAGGFHLTVNAISPASP